MEPAPPIPPPTIPPPCTNGPSLPAMMPAPIANTMPVSFAISVRMVSRPLRRKDTNFGSPYVTMVILLESLKDIDLVTHHTEGVHSTCVQDNMINIFSMHIGLQSPMTSPASSDPPPTIMFCYCIYAEYVREKDESTPASPGTAPFQ